MYRSTSSVIRRNYVLVQMCKCNHAMPKHYISICDLRNAVSIVSFNAFYSIVLSVLQEAYTIRDYLAIIDVAGVGDASPEAEDAGDAAGVGANRDPISVMSTTPEGTATDVISAVSGK